MRRRRRAIQAKLPPKSGLYGDLYQERLKAPEGSEREAILAKRLLANYPEFFANVLFIIPKGKGRTPFGLNAAQLITLEVVLFCLEHDIPIRVVILKARQKGLSTFIAGLIYSWCIVHSYSNAAVMAQGKGPAGTIFRMYERFHRFSTDETRPKRVAGSAQRNMEFENESRIGILVANENKGDERGEAGRGETIHYVHATELPDWDNAQATASALTGGVPREAGTAVFYESTAGPRGDHFHGLWEDSWKWSMNDEWGIEDIGWCENIGIFIPWHIDDEYTLSFADEDARDNFLNDMGTSDDARFGNEREMLETFPNYDVPYEMSVEHLHWRQQYIKTDLRGNLLQWAQEFPSTPDEAFAVAGGRWLNASIVSYHETTTIDPVFQGRLEPPSGSRPPRLLDEPNGWVKIYEDVQPFAEYIIGVDNARGNDDGDFNSAIVMKRNPATIVAEIHGRDFNRVKQTPFAHQIYYMALRYNMAWVCLEANYGEVANSVIGTQLKYSKLVRSSQLVMGAGRKPISKDPTKYGWWNNQNLRSFAQTLAKEWLEMPRHERVEANEYHYQPIDEDGENEEPYYNIVLSGDFLTEASRCVVGESGKVVAPNKHGSRRRGEPEWGYYDDRVYAWFGCLLTDHALPPAHDPRDMADWEDAQVMFDDYDAIELAGSEPATHIVGGIPKAWLPGVPRALSGGVRR
jgi:hypothetical protein